MTLKSRNNFGDFLNSLGLTGLGVEVGVYKGEFAKIILAKWRGMNLYLVDVWRPLPDYKDASNHSTYLSAMQIFTEAYKNLYEFGERAVMIRDNSLSASRLFEKESLDFVYIDANHEYEVVRADLAIWWTKVKKGGIFSGHDFVDGELSIPNGTYLGNFGVKRAVTEFAQEKNLHVHSTTEDAPFETWWIEKQ